MKTRARPTVLLETRSGYPYRYRCFKTRQGAMRSSALASALGGRVRIFALPNGAFTWILSNEPTPVGGRVVATFDGAGWVGS